MLQILWENKYQTTEHALEIWIGGCRLFKQRELGTSKSWALKRDLTLKSTFQTVEYDEKEKIEPQRKIGEKGTFSNFSCMFLNPNNSFQFEF